MNAHRPAVPADMKTAGAFLLKCYDSGAGAEALLRAFLAERDRDPRGAQFWIDVYALLAEQGGKS